MNLKIRVKLFIDILEESKINKLVVSSFWGFRKIKLFQDKFKSETEDRKSFQSKEPVKEVLDKTSNEVAIEQESSLDKNKFDEEKSLDLSPTDHIKAPLVGTVYLSSKPEDPAFVKEGDTVKEGQVVCIIEAMKIFNDIEADKSGIVSKILIKNEDPVEFGQELFEINPSD